MAETEEIFLTPESEARLDLIRHLIENSELVPLLRGIPGIGKSLLASRLQASAPKNWMVCHFSADSMMQPERLLAHIARCSGLPDAKDDNLRRLVDRFEMMRKRGSIPVLLIDDAQELPPTSLITLLRLYERQVGGGPLVSLVLFADEQIDMLLSTPQLQIMSPQSIQVIDLPPLTRVEADAYMRHLLRMEGLDAGLALDAGRMNRIYQDTRGAPGPLASAILREVGDGDAESPQGGRKMKLGRRAIWGLIPLGIVILLLLVLQDPINRLFSPEVELQTEPMVAADKPVPLKTTRAPGVPVTAEPLRQSSQPENAVAMQEGQSGVFAPAPSAAAERTPEPTAGEDESQKMPLAEASALEPPAANETEEEPEYEQAEGPSVDGVSAPAEAAVAAADPAEEAVTTSPEAAPSPDSDAEQGVDAVATPAPVEASSTAPEAAPPETPIQSVPRAVSSRAESPSLLKSPEWLSEQPAGSYTIQLLAVANFESIQSVVDKYNLQGEAFSVLTRRQGRDWFPLLWGSFPDRPSAVAAIGRLPAGLREGGAWARSMASLQAN